jgi:hypothetical protein
MENAPMKTMKMTALVLGVGVAAFAAGCGQGDVDGGGSAHPDERATGEAAVAAPAKPVSDALPAGYVHVPNGVVAHQDCVHEIPNGASVDLDGNVTLGGKLVAHFDACTHPITRGKRPDGVDRDKSSGLDNPPGPSNWIEATWTNAPANDEFISSTSTFKVPAAPSKDNGQIVYLFPSIQGGGGIVQPVLQYGAFSGGTAGTGLNGSGGGLGSNSAWTYASWGVTSSNVYHSTGITVNAGDTLESQMVAWSQSNNFISWEIVATDQTTGGQTWAVVDFADGTSLWNNAQAAVLEAYGITSCSNFPSTGYNEFTYPTLSQSTYGSPWSSKQTTLAPNSAIWTALYYTNGLSSGYAGPACNFDDFVATTSNGTTLQY